MNSDELPQSDDLRMSPTGEVEVFDGEVWRTVRIVTTNPDVGNRQDPPEDSPADDAGDPPRTPRSSGPPAQEPEQP